MKVFATLLGEPLRSAIGIMESLWHFTAKFAIQGDIGKWSDEHIAQAVHWDKDPVLLVRALVEARWVDECAERRLVVHDWSTHCEQAVKKTLENNDLQAFTAVVKVSGKTRRGSGNKQSDSTLPRLGYGSNTQRLGSGLEGNARDVVEAWNLSQGVRSIRSLDGDRLRKLKARLGESSWDWRAALAKFPLKCFSDGGWVPTFDWFLRKETVNAILEGKYDWTKGDKREPQKIGPGQQYQEGSKLSW